MKELCTCLMFPFWVVQSASAEVPEKVLDRAISKSVQDRNFKILRISLFAILHPNKYLAQNFEAWMPQVNTNLNFSGIYGYSENFIISIYFCSLILVD